MVKNSSQAQTQHIAKAHKTKQGNTTHSVASSRRRKDLRKSKACAETGMAYSATPRKGSSIAVSNFNVKRMKDIIVIGTGTFQSRPTAADKTPQDIRQPTARKVQAKAHANDIKWENAGRKVAGYDIQAREKPSYDWFVKIIAYALHVKRAACIDMGAREIKALSVRFA